MCQVSIVRDLYHDTIARTKIDVSLSLMEHVLATHHVGEVAEQMAGSIYEDYYIQWDRSRCYSQSLSSASYSMQGARLGT